MSEDKELEALMVAAAEEALAEMDAKCCEAASPPTMDYKWEHPDIVKSENEEGEVGSMIFPFGVKYFAEKYGAEAIYVGDGFITYFSEGRWKELDDNKSSTPVSLHKLPK